MKSDRERAGAHVLSCHLRLPIDARGALLSLGGLLIAAGLTVSAVACYNAQLVRQDRIDQEVIGR